MELQEKGMENMAADFADILEIPLARSSKSSLKL